MISTIQDLRFGIRTLMRNKVFTLVAVLSIALGIAVNATVFGWMHAVLFDPLPGVPDSSKLVIIKSIATDGHPINASYPDFRDIRESATTLSGAMAFVQRPIYLGEPPRMERVWAQTVSGNFFDVLGVKPILGRTFSREEQNAGPGAAPVIVIGETAWRSRFRSDPSLIGRDIQVNRRPYQVIGVVPASFRGAFPGLLIDFWIPLVMESQLAGGGDLEWMDRRSSRPLNITGRLKPGVTAAQADSEIASIARRLALDYPRTNEGIGAAAFPLSKSPEGAPHVLGPVLKVLLGITAMVLLIVCANVGNLLLARATSRHKEFGIRLSLGAGRGRLIRQLLTESLLLSAAGAALGLLGANWMYDSLRFVMPASELPAGIDARLDATAVLFTVGLCALTTLLCGLAPALQFSRPDIQDSLRQSGRGNSGGPAAARLRGLLVASEVSLAVVALIGAGLFLRSFDRARNVQPGFDPQNLLLAGVDLASAGCKGDECVARLERLRRRLIELPGVKGATVSDYVPLGFADGAWDTIKPEGYVPQRGESMLLYRIVVGPEYFETMRIPLVAGRTFDTRDNAASQPVAIVNEAFAQRFFPGGSAVGRRFDTWGSWATVTGVVKNAKYRRMVERPVPLFYVPVAQRFSSWSNFTVAIRTATAPEAMVQPVQRELQSVEGGIGFSGIMPMTQFIGASYFMERVAASFLTLLGALSVLLALLGLYGVMAYTITQRTNEIGIRIAIGAAPSNVVRMVIRDGLRMAIPGVGIGLLLAFAGGRAASSLLYGLNAADGGVIAAMCVLVLALSVMVSYVPARRAALLDPVSALRQE